jgi:hypothetical protein
VVYKSLISFNDESGGRYIDVKTKGLGIPEAIFKEMLSATGFNMESCSKFREWWT